MARKMRFVLGSVLVLVFTSLMVMYTLNLGVMRQTRGWNVTRDESVSLGMKEVESKEVLAETETLTLAESICLEPDEPGFRLLVDRYNFAESFRWQKVAEGIYVYNNVFGWQVRYSDNWTRIPKCDS